MESLTPTRPQAGSAGPLPQQRNSRQEKKIEKTEGLPVVDF